MHEMQRKVGIVLRDIRRARGLTEEVLSGLAGVSRSHLALIESGAGNPTIDTLARLADALSTPLSEVIQRAESQP